jgi:hypothetical protein
MISTARASRAGATAVRVAKRRPASEKRLAIVPVARGDPQPHAPEVEAVRVVAQPLLFGGLPGCGIRTERAAEVGVERRSVRGVVRVQVVGERDAAGARVPAPVAHGAEQGAGLVAVARGDGVGLREGLEAGDVDGDGELAVADGKRFLGTQPVEQHGVPLDQREPVDH